MASETDYRRLLKRAQDRTDEIAEFIGALEVAPQADAVTRKLAADARAHSRELDDDIERLWDHFKRLSAQS